jgi:hypothetical protein
MTDRAAWWAPANGFQPRSEPRVHLARRKIHASQRSGKPQTPIATRSARSHASVRGGCAKSRRCRSRSACITVRLGRPLGETILPGAPTNRRAAPATGRPLGFRPRRRAGAAPVTSLHGAHFPGTAEGCPTWRHGLRTARDKQRESPVGSPVLKLWNESRTNRARIADSIHVGFRSRPHIVADRSPTTKSCNKTDTVAATRASTR